MSLKSSMVRVRVLFVRMPLVVLVTEPSLSTFNDVPLNSQVTLGVGEASTVHVNDAFPPATPLTCEAELRTVGGTRKENMGRGTSNRMNNHKY